ncbi:2-hydroxyacid dehydrogenase [Afifella marina]|uniref:D-lactate dehydrogenase n=1 Tax=Afifella marina DSM 2698 TaxID=1120955 RepID=A0A1G5MN07_AFIMA|nr:2-hydroxyacid dehydrogenase [Afifella marina]MBK1623914.1 2-hydroxyacid dehydrogenase [Afifella marina DSM 2698]MBK1627170.1 2-hydroxyacid dehydrogenase [Afifella marina]MBK5918801.1 hydroxyacid dehydrogenase [Afifella marina]RAI22591.1 hydroxyacid dehydrogenase [Afifella marina DSM 2698]SCZ25968.1 D-lactate dehydrogenase [Afifella marina DSM 2698]
MKVAVFSTKNYDRDFFEKAAEGSGHELHFFEPHLTRETAPLARGADAVCIFVNDSADAETLAAVKEEGVRFVALRCAGFNNVDLAAAHRLGMSVARVPAYSPHAVAEYTIGLILALNRKLCRAHNRVREGNFSLEGLLGFDLKGKTAGVVGTGAIGAAVVKILKGFGMHVLTYDLRQNPDCVADGAQYVSVDELFAASDIITLHCPLTPDTRHLVDADRIASLKPGCMLINTSRGALVDARAVIDGLKSGQIGSLGLDVYEEEADLFFEDLSNYMLQDDVFARLLTFPNVLITGHQAFFTEEALSAIAETTIANLTGFEKQGRPEFEVSVEAIR